VVPLQDRGHFISRTREVRRFESLDTGTLISGTREVSFSVPEYENIKQGSTMEGENTTGCMTQPREVPDIAKHHLLLDTGTQD
jgi:hypothetical protein